MENGIDKESGSMLFSEEELIEVSGLKKGGDFVEVTCGCTSHRYGDAVGKLRVFSNGHLEITCECTPGCNEDKLTPAAFEKHSGRETARKWKNNVWLIVKGEKVPLSKTAFLKYYNQASKNGNGIHKAHGGRVCHRDEFVRCNRCKKERRFRLRTKEECRIHHDALADVNWKCSDILYDRHARNTVPFLAKVSVFLMNSGIKETPNLSGDRCTQLNPIILPSSLNNLTSNKSRLNHQLS
ncbi:hypothetical protein GOBAR_AA06412 [Gossypium barbadense]|uniref:SAND domain-containing protein n=1 Tax=Gossypium barbadense TaxID=3634 RepID=A0A2P5YEY6_GOSBA|nr:hypothetical protein GOBAR_AA06412 [Gossypium barbadense]